MVTLEAGSIFAGRYRIVRCIAHGGMGAVYEAIHVETDRRRALKVMLPTMLESKEMRDRFRQEARVTAQIETEYIVDVLDAGIDEATEMPFLAMELLRGEELDKRLKRVGRLDPHEVVTLLYQVAVALDKTHAASIVHRDLKPANLFLTEREDGSPRIKVLDFGIAKLVAEGATGAATQTLGTPLYMAPEQFQVGRKVTPAVDIYALGMIGYTLLVGMSYWRDELGSGSNVYALIATAVHGPPEPATVRAARRGVDLPPEFDAWFTTATARSPSDRFPTATAAIIALAEVLGLSVAPQRASFVARTPSRASHPSHSSLSPTVASSPVATMLDASGSLSLDGATVPMLRAHSPAPAVERSPAFLPTGSLIAESASVPEVSTSTEMVRTTMAKGRRTRPAVVGALVLVGAVVGVAGFLSMRGAGQVPAASIGEAASGVPQPVPSELSPRPSAELGASVVAPGGESSPAPSVSPEPSADAQALEPKPRRSEPKPRSGAGSNAAPTVARGAPGSVRPAAGVAPMAAKKKGPELLRD